MTLSAPTVTPILHPGPRERALDEGTAALGDAELLAVVLGTGLAGRPASLVAAALLDHAGGLEGLARSGPAAIAEQPGIGLVKAVRVAAAIELGRRAIARASRARVPVRTSADVLGYVRATIGLLEHEEMWVLALDGRNNIRSARRVAQGGLHACTVAVRDVLRVAVSEAASAIVVVHNHPSGDPMPSHEDVQMTRLLHAAAEVVGVPLIDHLIVTAEGRYSSMLDLGVIAPR